MKKKNDIRYFKSNTTNVYPYYMIRPLQQRITQTKRTTKFQLIY